MEFNESVDVLELMTLPGVRSNPYPLYEWLREHHPVYLNPTGNTALISSYRDAALMRNPALRGMDAERMAAASPRYATSRAVRAAMDSLVNKNRPEHTRLRRAVANLFTETALASVRRDCVQECGRRVAALTERLREGETVDAHTDLTVPLAAHTIGALIGIPEEDRVAVYRHVGVLFEGLQPRSTPDALRAADDATAATEAYTADLAARGTIAPDSALAVLHDPDTYERYGVTADECRSLLWMLWLAGYESTIAALDHAVIIAARNPQHTHLLGHPEERKNYIHECLRYETPIWINASRLAASADIDTESIAIPEGTSVHLMPGAANRDPVQFDRPDVFDPRRRNASAHLSFSLGIHRCVAAPLAMLEMDVLLETLHERLPRITLAEDPLYTNTSTQRTLEKVPVALDA